MFEYIYKKSHRDKKVLFQGFAHFRHIFIQKIPIMQFILTLRLEMLQDWNTIKVNILHAGLPEKQKVTSCVTHIGYP